MNTTSSTWTCNPSPSSIALDCNMSMQGSPCSFGTEHPKTSHPELATPPHRSTFLDSDTLARGHLCCRSSPLHLLHRLLWVRPRKVPHACRRIRKRTLRRSYTTLQFLCLLLPPLLSVRPSEVPSACQWNRICKIPRTTVKPIEASCKSEILSFNLTPESHIQTL